MVVVVCVCDEQFLAVAWGAADSPGVAWLRRLWPIFAVLYATSVPHTHTHTHTHRLGDGGLETVPRHLQASRPGLPVTGRRGGDWAAWRAA